MKKARNLWRDLPQGGSRYGSVLTRLFLLLCLLATTQAGWATKVTWTANETDVSTITADPYNKTVGSGTQSFILYANHDNSNINGSWNSSKKAYVIGDNALKKSGISVYIPNTSDNVTSIKVYMSTSNSRSIYYTSGSSLPTNNPSTTQALTTTDTGYELWTSTTTLPKKNYYSVGGRSGGSGDNYITKIEVTFNDGGGSTTVEAPTFDPASNSTVTVGDDITLATTTDGATIHWKWDNNTDVASSTNTGTTASTAALSAGSHTLYAVAVKDGTNSVLASATYTVNAASSTSAAAPTICLYENASYLTESSTNTYTYDVTKAEKTIKIRLYAQPRTWINWTVSTDGTVPADPTFSNSSNYKNNTGNSSQSQTSNILSFKNTTSTTYYIKAIAFSDNTGSNPSAVQTFVFQPSSVTPSIAFNSPTTTVEVGKTVTNAATLSNATGTEITYSSSDTSVAEVDNTGKVTGIAAGTTTITATYRQNSTDYTDSYVMTVPESYTITKASATGGSFTVKVGGSVVTSATAGTMVTITTTPDSGKEVDAVTLSPSGSVTKASDNNYTFTMPASAVTVTVTFKDATVSGLTPVTSYTWAVDQSDWNSYTTSSEIKANTIVDNIEVIADNNHSVKFGSQKKNFTDGNSFTKFWKLGTPGSEFRLLHFKVAGRCKISAYVYQGSNRTVEIRKGSYGGTVIAETDISSSTPTIVSGDYTDNTEADIYVYSKSNELGVFAIKVEPLAAEVSAPTITAEGTTYTDNKSVTITREADSGTTYYKVGATAETSASAIIDAGNSFTEASKEITASPASDESNIVVSAVTVKDGNYSDVVTATYTYAGLRSFQVKAADKTLQRGGRDNVDPYITYLDGTLFDLSDAEHDLSYYFTFRYAKTGEAAVTVGEETGIINVSSDAIKDQTATITITATPTPEGEAIFKGGAQTGTMTVTVKEKESGTKMSFYWDPECTEANKVQDTEWGEGEGKRSVFNNPYENGRMIYVKPDPGYEVWVATVSSKTKNDSSLDTPTASIGTYDDTHYSTTHGIPLYISGMSDGEERTLVIGLKAYKAGTTEGVGSAVSARFSIKQTEDGQANRPDAPTFSPTKSEAGTLSTAQTVAAVGAVAKILVLVISSTIWKVLRLVANRLPPSLPRSAIVTSRHCRLRVKTTNTISANTVLLTIICTTWLQNSWLLRLPIMSM